MAYKEDVKNLRAKLDEQKKIFNAQDLRAKAAKDAAKKEGQDEAKQLEAADRAAEPTTEEIPLLKSLSQEIQQLNTKCEESKEFHEMRERNESLMGSLKTPGHRPDYGGGPQEEIKSAGQAIVENDDFKSWWNRVAPLGANGDRSMPNSKMNLESPVVNLKDIGLGDLRDFDKKALVMTTPGTAGGSLVRREYGPWPIDLPLRPLTIRDVITILQTGSNLIEYVRVNALTRAAKIVPEATSTTDDAALKPEAGMALEIVQTAVKTIAVLMPVTRTILADAPQLESMITNFLRTDIDLELEEEIISGPGGAEHFTGLENTPNLTPQPFVEDKLKTARKARTQALITGRARSTGYLMNPLDWEDFDLTKDLEGRYYFGGPLAMGTKMLWGLPVIESEVIPQGTFYTGDLKQLVVWDRQDPTLYMTDSHKDYFARNIITILYEGRWAFGVLRPPAIVKGDFVAGANS
jgi:HK97 family phage major capsid protein